MYDSGCLAAVRQMMCLNTKRDVTEHTQGCDCVDLGHPVNLNVSTYNILEFRSYQMNTAWKIVFWFNKMGKGDGLVSCSRISKV